MKQHKFKSRDARDIQRMQRNSCRLWNVWSNSHLPATTQVQPQTDTMKNKSVSKDTDLGQVFVNKNAQRAYERKKLNSILNDGNTKIRVVFVNQTGMPLTLCWVHQNGKLHHFYRLETCSPTITSLDSDGLQIRHRGSHLENTCLGHAFVLGLCAENGNTRSNDKDKDDDDGNDDSSNDADQRIGNIIAGYRPTKTSVSMKDDDVEEESEGTYVHLVTITQIPAYSCNRRLRFHRTKSKFQVKVTQCAIDASPLDTSDKIYHDVLIGGWKCKCEQGLFTSGGDEHLAKVKTQLEVDLLACSKKLPREACKLLKRSTPIWINKCQKYGPKCAPVQARGACFHPGSDWLVENGMSSTKCGGVELYEAGKYLEDHSLWQEGGVMLHELSHAWHNKFTTDGYSNPEIKECYERGMEEKLYDSVKVHNHEGGTDECKAYAATDPMEYFAELSVAFLGGVGADKDLEYNKWYPFNRQQLKDHDPRAFNMLQKMWGVEVS